MVRTVAVFDAFGAMTEDRPYEDAWPWQEALKRLGSMPEQYDSEVVGVVKVMLQQHGTNKLLSESLSIVKPGKSRTNAGVLRPRSAFYAPRSRQGVRLCD